MQSDSGIASQALCALAAGDEDEYQRCYEELLRRYPPGSPEPEWLIREAGSTASAVAACIVNYTFGRAAEINRLHAWLVRLTDEAVAEDVLLSAFLTQAVNEVHPDRVQRLYKVACRYVNPVLVTKWFKEKHLVITVPFHVTMMMSSARRRTQHSIRTAISSG